MKSLRAWAIRVLGLFRSGPRRDFAEELQSHIEMQTEENIRIGMSPKEARREAIIKIGSVESTTEKYCEQSTVPSIENLFLDTRFALRQLRRNPGFTITAISILALGMGSCIAIFSYVDAALLKPLPYRDPNRLVHVTESVAVFPRANLSYFDYLDWKSQNKVFSSFSVFNGRGIMLATPNGNEVATGARVSDAFFRTLGVSPILGRDFYSGEDKPEAPYTVILSYAAWQKRFGGRSDIIGQTIRLNDNPTTVIGILPQDFQFAPRGDAEFWIPLQPTNECEKRRSCHNLNGVARLKDGVTVEAARANMTAIAKQLEQQYPDSNRGQGASVEPLYEVIVGDIRPILLVLLAGAFLLQVIASVNVVSLLLVRFESRRREIAVRGALGASSSRLVRQFVTEAFVLVAIATTAALFSAYASMKVLSHLLSKDMLFQMPYFKEMGMNNHVLAFAAGIASVSLLLFSLAPILRLSGSEMREDLTEAGRSASGSVWRRFGSNLVVVELAVAMVLLVGAGLLGKSFYRLLNVNLAFDPEHLVTIGIAPSVTKYSKDEKLVQLQHKLLERVESLPGVTEASLTNIAPVSGNGNTDWVRIVGKPYNGEHNEVNQRSVSSKYFSTIKTRLLRGRFFTEHDDITKPLVAIINKTFAEKYFPGEDPIGQKIGDTQLSPKSLKEIVGVVDDLREGSLESEIMPAEYLPFNQAPENSLILVVRTAGPEEFMVTTISEAVRQIDPELSTMAETTMLQRIRSSQTAYLHRSAAWLVGGFASIALLLGTIGLYGVIAYSVSRRTREIGVRMALGAERSSVYQLILSEAGRLTLIGLFVGIGLSILAASLMTKLLFNVRAWDFTTLLAVSILLGMSAVLASYVPARRAASVNPMEALRTE